MNRTRIYVFLGSANSLTDFMSSMETAGLFARGEYMVIYVDMMVYSERYEAELYISLSCTLICMFSFNSFSLSFSFLAVRHKSICVKWIKSIAWQTAKVPRTSISWPAVCSSWPPRHPPLATRSSRRRCETIVRCRRLISRCQSFSQWETTARWVREKIPR